MLRSKFGYANYGNTKAIDSTILNVVPSSYVEQQVLLRMAYETDYGIQDHTVETHPWATILVNPKEDLSKINPYRLAADKYLGLGFLDKTGLSFTEYLRLERSQIEMLREAMIHFNQLTEEIKEKVKNEMESGKKSK